MCDHGKLHCSHCCTICKAYFFGENNNTTLAKAKRNKDNSKWIQAMNFVWNRTRGN